MASRVFKYYPQTTSIAKYFFLFVQERPFRSFNGLIAIISNQQKWLLLTSSSLVFMEDVYLEYNLAQRPYIINHKAAFYSNHKGVLSHAALYLAT